MIKRIVVTIAIAFICFASAVAVTNYLDKDAYSVHMRCPNGKCYVFWTTGRKSLWFEICRKTNIAVQSLTGTLGK